MKHLPAAALSSALLAALMTPSADATIAPVPTGAMVFHVDVDANATKVELPKFNPAMGELRAVRFSLRSDLDGSVGLENTADTATMATFALGAQSSLSMDGRERPLLSVMPSLEMAHMLSGYDGKMDYSGMSGFNLAGFTLSEEASAAPSLSHQELSSFNAEYPGDRANLSLSKRAVEAVQGGSGLQARLSAEGRVRVTVAYMYAPHS